jgi:O-antigen/teichoic acid export membrane protein
VSRIRANTLALTTSFFVTAFLAFIQVKIVTNYLDKDAVGVWSALVAVGAVLTAFSQLGLPFVLVRYGAKFDAEGRLGRLQRLWWFAVIVHLPAMAAMVLLLVVAGPALSRVLGEGEVDRWLLILGYLAAASGSLRAFNNASFRGLRRMTAVAVIEIAFAAMVTAAYFILRDRLTVSLVLVIALASSVLWSLVGVVHLLRIARPHVQALPPEDRRRPVLPEIKAYWQGAAATGIFLVAIEQLDKPLLAGLVSFEQLAVFYVAARLALFARRLLYVPFQVMNPEITHKWEGRRRDELRADMELFTKLALGLGLSLLVFLGVFARPLILLISTPDFLSGAPVLWVFLGVLPLICLHQPMVMFLRATGHVWHAFVGDSAWLLTYLGLGALLVRPLGLPGFVAGQIVASSLILVYNLIVFHRLDLPRPPVAFFVRRVILGAVVWGLSSVLGMLLPAWPWPVLFGVMVAVAVLGNFVLVRGRFLTPGEEQRTVTMLAGRGALGRGARFLLTWPRLGSGPDPAAD